MVTIFTHLKFKKIKYKNLLKKSKKPIFIIGQGPLISDEAENLFYFLLDIYNKSSISIGRVLMFYKIILVELVP